MCDKKTKKIHSFEVLTVFGIFDRMRSEFKYRRIQYENCS